ncbi:MAG: hypothetical protein KF795_34170, partial [Labilithrix sp.]|nr:hypothetical protein [Labilithrix sp.]
VSGAGADVLAAEEVPADAGARPQLARSARSASARLGANEQAEARGTIRRRPALGFCDELAHGGALLP